MIGTVIGNFRLCSTSVRRLHLATPFHRSLPAVNEGSLA